MPFQRRVWPEVVPVGIDPAPVSSSTRITVPSAATDSTLPLPMLLGEDEVRRVSWMPELSTTPESISSLLLGLVVPMPMLPALVTKKEDVPEDWMSKSPVPVRLKIALLLPAVMEAVCVRVPPRWRVVPVSVMPDPAL